MKKGVHFTNNQPANVGNSIEHTISVHEIANAGYDPGNSQISGADNPETGGAVSYDNRSEFNDPTQDIAWVDASGNDVANLEGSFITLGTQAAFDVPPPPSITFDVDAATAQAWLDNGLAGLALSAEGPIDTNGRFQFVGGGAATSIAFNTVSPVPEPTSASLLALCGSALFFRRRRR